MYKESIILTQNNFTLINQDEFDQLYNTLLINMPIKVKGQK